MTLQYANELLTIEFAEMIDKKNKRIEELEIENSMLKIRLEQYESQATSFQQAELNLKDTEAVSIKNALEKHGNNRRAAAKALGISERTLYRRIIDLGL